MATRSQSGGAAKQEVLSPPPFQITLSETCLAPLVEQIVRHVLAGQAGRVAYTEAEAAELLGVPAHVLRDARLRGEITGKRLGKKVIYAADELRAFARRPA